MIISVSRRTDIPCYYADWFLTQLNNGFVTVVNPFNAKQIRRVSLLIDEVDCFVFWTKNAIPFMHVLKHLDDMKYAYMFMYTITPYEADIEVHLPDKALIVSNFISISSKIGKERMTWRYDPILLTEKYTIEYHTKMFKELCLQLAPYCSRVIISFVDVYKKNKKASFQELTTDEKEQILVGFKKIAEENNISINTCAEDNMNQSYVVNKPCIDNDEIMKIAALTKHKIRATGQRKSCLCSNSIDIGRYNTCLSECIYCYATMNKKRV